MEIYEWQYFGMLNIHLAIEGYRKEMYKQFIFRIINKIILNVMYIILLIKPNISL